MKFYLGLLLIFFVTCNQVEEEVNLEKINWKGIKECFNNIKALVPEVKEIIQLIKKWKLKKAFNAVKKLWKEGKQTVKDCISGIKSPNLTGFKFKPKKWWNKIKPHIKPFITDVILPAVL